VSSDAINHDLKQYYIKSVGVNVTYARVPRFVLIASARDVLVISQLIAMRVLSLSVWYWKVDEIQPNAF
jgi:hypothetical protein